MEGLEVEKRDYRHVNPLIIFGVAIFGVMAFYLSIVVVSQASGIFFPGNEPNFGVFGKIPGVDENAAPEVVTIDDRINILFMGLDLRRDEPADQAARTDSVLILTLDPHNKVAGVLSIPRDTWVEIPDGYGGYTNDRINVAYEMGEYTYRDYDGGGAGLIKDTIEHNFGIPIDQYVLLNFNNFIELVDELGGIEVDVPEYAYDYAYSDCNACYEYEVEFLPGPEHMDGERALAYARIRKSDNDFKRIERQQVVIQSTAQRAADLGVLVGSNPIDLYKKYKDSVKTDISDSKIPGLALLGQQIGPTNIRMVSMAEATYSCIDVCGGAAGLLWNLDKVEELKARVFNDGRVQATLDSEAATVEVLNGTETRDLAAEFASFLKRQGIPSTLILVDEQAGGELSERTLIFDRSGKSYTVEKLAEWLNLPATRIRTIPDSDIQRFLDVALGSDVIVVLGDDVNLPSEESANTSFEQTETAGG